MDIKAALYMNNQLNLRLNPPFSVWSIIGMVYDGVALMTIPSKGFTVAEVNDGLPRHSRVHLYKLPFDLSS